MQKNMGKLALLHSSIILSGVCLLGLACTNKKELSSAPAHFKQVDAGPQVPPEPVFEAPFFASAAYLGSHSGLSLSAALPDIMRALALKPDCGSGLASDMPSSISDAGISQKSLKKPSKQYFKDFQCEYEVSVAESPAGIWEIPNGHRLFFWHQKMSHLPNNTRVDSVLRTAKGKLAPAQLWSHYDKQSNELLIIAYLAETSIKNGKYQWHTEWHTDNSKIALNSVDKGINLKQ